jgi:hypothetical protein
MMDSKRKPRQVWETQLRANGRKSKAKDRMGRTYSETDEEKSEGKILLEATRLLKERKAFHIWLMNSNA